MGQPVIEGRVKLVAGSLDGAVVIVKSRAKNAAFRAVAFVGGYPVCKLTFGDNCIRIQDADVLAGGRCITGAEVATQTISDIFR